MDFCSSGLLRQSLKNVISPQCYFNQISTKEYVFAYFTALNYILDKILTWLEMKHNKQCSQAIFTL